MSLGETFVIRIYRRGESAAARDGESTPQSRFSDRFALAGLLEDPVSGETRAFSAIGELIELLCAARK